MLPAGRHRQLLDDAKRAGVRKLWRSELRLHAPGDSHGMYGSGLLLFNPPWGVAQALDEAMRCLLPHLGDAAAHRSDWWVEG